MSIIRKWLVETESKPCPGFKFKQGGQGGKVPGPEVPVEKGSIYDLLPGEHLFFKDKEGSLSMENDKNETGGKYLKRIVLKGPATGDVMSGKSIHTGLVDVYAVIEAFGVTCPARAHAIKKLLCPGVRGAKDVSQDLKEAKDAIIRACQMEAGREVVRVLDDRITVERPFAKD
jgi:hypothetical protein